MRFSSRGWRAPTMCYHPTADGIEIRIDDDEIASHWAHLTVTLLELEELVDLARRYQRTAEDVAADAELADR